MEWTRKELKRPAKQLKAHGKKAQTIDRRLAASKLFKLEMAKQALVLPALTFKR